MSLSNPLAVFVGMLSLAAGTRSVDPLVHELSAPFGTAEDNSTMVEDVMLLLTHGPVVGIRSSWVRRVAQPIYMAHKHLLVSRESDRFAFAYEIASQCRDLRHRGRALTYICDAEHRAAMREKKVSAVRQFFLGLFGR